MWLISLGRWVPIPAYVVMMVLAGMAVRENSPLRVVGIPEMCSGSCVAVRISTEVWGSDCPLKSCPLFGSSPQNLPSASPSDEGPVRWADDLVCTVVEWGALGLCQTYASNVGRSLVSFVRRLPVWVLVFPSSRSSAVSLVSGL